MLVVRAYQQFGRKRRRCISEIIQHQGLISKLNSTKAVNYEGIKLIKCELMGVWGVWKRGLPMGREGGFGGLPGKVWTQIDAFLHIRGHVFMEKYFKCHK